MTWQIPPPLSPTLAQFLESHNLALLPHPTKHRILVTTVPLTRGTCVFTCSPLATVALDNANHCNTCLKSGAATAIASPSLSNGTLNRCTACKRAYYCSSSCQRRDWSAGHSVLCKKWKGKSLVKEDWEKDWEMLVKVARAVDPSPRWHTDCDQIDPASVEAFATLMSHEGPCGIPNHWASLTTATATEAHSASTLMTFLHRFRNNNFTITDPELFVIGEGTYPLAALLNHSCSPNTSTTFDGHILVIRAMCDIAPGTELLGTYVDAVTTRVDRQTVLWQKYGFKCSCERCAWVSSCVRETGVASASPFGLVDAYLGQETDAHHSAELSSWLSQQLEASPVLFLASLQDVFFRVTHLQSQTSPTTVQDLIRTTFAHIPPASLLSDSTASHIALLNHLTNPPHRIHSRDTYAHLSRILHSSLDVPDTRHAILSLYIFVMLVTIYEAGHPLLAQHSVLATKLCWNAFCDDETATTQEGRSAALTVVRELGRVARRLIALSFGHVAEPTIVDLDHVLALVDGQLART
ncbi:hypothetical protein PhCBS80983_g02933 [Powellomyces hirtus]|uniref:MYND-type domain-containing protein n=1 Tax=Powellomyces hirtus TaxID=109895 RepID=A0A507E6M1_9FUNG|nr:hypothetical protein PhCBS80983_g02933 [Powellomyces hirtus]